MFPTMASSEQPRQIPHCMNDTTDYHRAVSLFIEDEVFLKTLDRPGADTDETTEAALRSDIRIPCDGGKCFLSGDQKSVGGLQIIMGNSSLILLEVEPSPTFHDVAHRRRGAFPCS